MSKELEIVRELQLELESVKKSLTHLKISFTNCNQIGLKSTYTEDELEKWEALQHVTQGYLIFSRKK